MRYQADFSMWVWSATPGYANSNAESIILDPHIGWALSQDWTEVLTWYSYMGRW